MTEWSLSRWFRVHGVEKDDGKCRSHEQHVQRLRGRTAWHVWGGPYTSVILENNRFGEQGEFGDSV